MKLTPQKRADIASAAMVQTLWLVAGCMLLFAVVAGAATPSWWSSPGTGSQGAVVSTQVVTNNGVVSTNYVPNDNDAITQGQMKQFTTRAVDELNSYLPGGAGTNLNNLVQGWEQDYATNNYGSPTNAYAPYKPSDFTAMNVGQLKTIANMVYGTLASAGYVNLTPTWLSPNTNTDNLTAAIGQAKQIFNFDFSLSQASSLTATSGSPGTINLNWTLNGTNSGSWVVEEQNPDGSWTILSTLAGSATSYTATGLTNGQNYSFQVFASSTNNISATISASGAPSATPAAIPTATPSAGSYPSLQVVTVSSTTSNATIYYTTDGSTPTTGSMSVASGGSIPVSGSEILKFCAAAPGFCLSSSATSVYVIGGALAAGWNHSVLLKTDGTVWTWGADNKGQLGDNQAGGGVPQQITAFSSAIAVGAGDSHSLAVDVNGNVWAWGYNADGELGDGTQTQRNSAVQVQSGNITSPVVAVAGGSRHSLALDSTGCVWAWGDNSLGQLGTGDHAAHLAPVKITGLSNIVAISAHGWHNLALDASGSIWAWGDNTYGQIGNGVTSTSGQTTPVQIFGPGSGVAIACGTEHSVAIMSDGSVDAWGANYNGQLGLGNLTQATSPQTIPNLTGITTLVANSDYTIGLEGSSVIGWGNNNIAQLERACYQVYNSPYSPADSNEFSLLAAGGQHVVALQSTGSVWGWGNITGAGPSLLAALVPGVPANISLNGSATSVSARDMSSRATLLDQMAVAWGQNFNGNLGDGTTNEQNAPTLLTSLYNVGGLTGSANSGVAVDNFGNAFTWGLNTYGQIGGGLSLGTLNAAPTQVAEVSNLVTGASSAKDTLLLDNAGHVWGAGDPVALGLSGSSDIATFQQLSGLVNIQSVCLGQGFGLALKSDGTVWTMSGGTTSQVSGLPTISSIWAAGQHSFAIDGSGNLWAWGDNGYGQLGTGSTTAVTTPIEIASSSFGSQAVKKVSGDAFSTIALTVNGQVWAWGGNTYYQLGDGTTTQHLTPHLTSLTGKATDIAMGYYHALALKEDGSVASWGTNLDGELGLGVSQVDGGPRQIMGVGAVGNAPTITTPSAPPSSVPMGTPFTLQPTATASAGHNIAAIIYYVEGVQVGQSYAAPFSFAWTPPTWGTFHFNFVAVDDQGLESAPLSTAYTVNVPYDSDGNGLPDWWELKYFSQLGNSPTSSPDNNGLTLLQDYQQGNDPTNYYSQGGTIITPTITIVSGNNQSGTPGSFLPSPLVVKVTNSSGTPLTNAPVTLSVSTGNGGFASSGSSTSPIATYATTTDSNGFAQAYFQPGLIANFSFAVTVTAASSHATFTEITPADSSAPAAPGNTVAACGCYTGQILLSWVNKADNATYLTIQQSTDNVNWSTIATLNNAMATTWYATGLTVGQPYYFRISAGN